MDVLPKEMLLEIFHFLSARDLIALTETCSTFYRLISSSEKLLNKVPLYLNVDVDKLVIREFIPRGATEVEVKNFITEILINGCRTYSRIVVGDIEGGIGVDILHRFGSSVRQLTFRRGFYGLKHICKMLVVCPNVNRLKFTRGSLRGDIDVAGLELPRLYIQSLHLENVGSQIFSILKESKVHRLECTIGRRICQHEFIPEELGNFLNISSDLKHLKLERIAWNINDMFENGHLDGMNFHLESLSLNDVLIDTSNVFSDFMKLHFATLKSLDLIMIEDFNFSQILRQLPRLERLRVIGTPIDIYEPLVTVKKLELEYPQLIRHFPNLTSLKLSCAQFGPYQIHLWDEYFNQPHLESIEVGNLSLLNFPRIRTLKRLKLLNVERIYVEVFYENPQIEEVVIEKRAGLIMRYDNEVEFISNQLPNLKLLEIVGGKICRRFLNLVRERCVHLKYLRLINVDVVAS